MLFLSLLQLLFFPLTTNLKDCTPLHNVAVKEAGLFRSTSHGLVPVPFQIDERRKDGTYRMEWILSGGEWIRDKLEKGDLYITAEDELVFEESSLGKKHYFKGGVTGCEIEVEGKGFLYLLRSSHREGRKMGIYDKEKRIFKGVNLSIGFTDERYPATINYMTFGGERNLLDRVKLKLTFSFLGGRVKVIKTEEDMEGGVTGYKEGAVRSLIRYRVRTSLAENVSSPWREGVLEIYRDMIALPVETYIPFGSLTGIGETELLLSFDFSKNMKGALLRTEKLIRPVVMDGKTSDAEKSLDGSDSPGWVEFEKNFLRLGVVLKSEGVSQRSFFYREDEKESTGEFGWRLRGLKGGSEIKVFILKLKNDEKIQNLYPYLIRGYRIKIKPLN